MLLLGAGAGFVSPAHAQPTAPAAATAAKPADAAAAARADALSEAARKGDVAAVTRLLDEGVDVNTKFRYGVTALSYASDRGHVDVVRLLLERGADANTKDTFYGATPLNWASRPAQARKPGHATIVGLLLKHGARGQDGALFAAIDADDEAMTRIVVAHGGLSATTLSEALEGATREKKAPIVAVLEGAGAKLPPVVTLSEAQLARYAGAYSNGQTTVTFELKDGKLQGGPPGQNRTLIARAETTFAVEGARGLSIAFTLAGEKAESVTVTQGGTPTVYKRVEGK
jgi:ankyrin repeat protein